MGVDIRFSIESAYLLAQSSLVSLAMPARRTSSRAAKPSAKAAAAPLKKRGRPPKKAVKSEVPSAENSEVDVRYAQFL